jgi:cytoskeletal protein CcmA (bactofilin family)
MKPKRSEGSMFGSKVKSESVEPAEPPPMATVSPLISNNDNKLKGGTPETTVVGKNTMIEGTIRVCGPVQVDGHIDGALVAEGHVSIGPTGTIVGELVADELVLRGRIDGKISVRDHLHVAPGATARGELRYGSLQVDRGGVIDGSTLQSDAATPTEPVRTTEASRVPPPPPPLPAAARVPVTTT